MKKFLVSICTMLAMTGSAWADDTFSMDDVTLPQNSEADVVIRFSLDAGSTCSGYTFWLQIPDELEFVTDGTKYVYTLGDSYADTPTFTPNLSEGYLKVACLTANSDPLTNQTGTLVTFKVKVKDAATVSVGDTFTGKLTNGTISAENGSVHDVANAAFTITIGEPADTRTVLDETSTAAPVAATGVDVRVKRSISAGVWNTLVLPFSMTAEQVKAAFGSDVQLADFTSWESEEDDGGDIININVGFTPVTAIEANHPYIIKVSAAVAEFTVDGVDIDPEDEPTVQVGKKKAERGYFIGTYNANTPVPEENLFLSNNKFYYSTGATKMKAFRGYFEFADVLASFDASAPQFSIVIGEDGTTDIDAIRQLDNLQSDNWYDLQGRKIVKSSNSKMRPGLYIRNGRKEVLK